MALIGIHELHSNPIGLKYPRFNLKSCQLVLSVPIKNFSKSIYVCCVLAHITLDDQFTHIRTCLKHHFVQNYVENFLGFSWYKLQFFCQTQFL